MIFPKFLEKPPLIPLGTIVRSEKGYHRKTEEGWEECPAPGVDHHDPIEHPSHYRQGQFECIDVIEDWGLGFHLGNCIKYLCRAEHKGKELEDLKKAKWYLDRYISLREKELGND